jgi:hypothetical protein
MALVDAAIRAAGPGTGEAIFKMVKPAAIAILPARRICVTNTFLRSLKKARSEGDDEAVDEEEAGVGAPTFGSTLRYREICHMSGEVTISIGLRSDLPPALIDAARVINYFGARGGFFQLREACQVASINKLCTVVDPMGWSPPEVPVGGLASLLDDLGPEATLARISPFSPEGARWQVDRRAVMALLAVRRVSSGPHWTHYERIEE